MLRTALITFIAILASATVCAAEQPEPTVATASYIVQADSYLVAKKAVIGVGGAVSHELRIINAVGATLSVVQLVELSKDSRLKIQKDRSAGVAAATLLSSTNLSRTTNAGDGPSSYLSTIVGAADIHRKGITGKGVTVAVVDTGYYETEDISKDPDGSRRVLAQYDAIAGQVVSISAASGAPDANGHGSHVTSIIANSERDQNGNYLGVAPGVNIVAVKAFDGNGNGTYLDVIRGLDWILTNADTYNIRVVNLSFSAEAQSHYWDDPINQAVMRLWYEGIVIVASAGNKGPDAMTIGVPGNVPYVITVGSMNDNGTPLHGEDDTLSSFSSAGPTVEGFVKPEIVAPGNSVIGLMDNGAHKITMDHPEFMFSFGDSDKYFSMSGTSQSAAIVSGVVALMLQYDDKLKPDEIKCKLMSGAKPAVNDAGELAYSVFQQGAGLVNAYSALRSQEVNCANAGMDLKADLNGKLHYGGRANVDEDGNYYLMDLDGYLWTNTSPGTDGYLWTNGYCGPTATSGPTPIYGRTATLAPTATSGPTATFGQMATSGQTATCGPTATSGPITKRARPGSIPGLNRNSPKLATSAY